MVLHLSNFHLEGGAGVAAARLHRALLKSNVESTLLVSQVTANEPGVSNLSNNALQTKKALARFIGERLYFYPQEKDASVRFAFSPAEVGADISNHPLVQQADVIHLHWINFGFLSLDSLDKLFSLGKPIVWTLHDMWTFTGGCHYSRGCEKFLTHCHYCPYLAKPEEYDISFQQFERKQEIYNNTKMALISPSQWLDNLVKKAALTADITSSSIPNCIDTVLFKPLEKSVIWRKLNLSASKKLILFAGANTSDPRKGFIYFKQALEKIGLLSSEIEVMVLGKANPKAMDTFPLPVHYLGKISDPAKMVDAYNAADMIVVPSLEDNLPNTIMEAMSCGTPAVGFATGGIPEMIDHQINGYIALQGSAQSLAEGIEWLLNDENNARMSENARAKVLETYAESIVASQYQQLYQSLLSHE
ncbi:glycosyltransferase family 4 protein [Dyadobacter fanqingshengii]|uniref:Glycosyltransferase family 4 protein n=1 Tax=Dyadobacter fanqingshengii TaxID=2906443 RepID=A0A9X1P755_9BACT|nr:glycosyltransferase family 4 protein [Dyadobacter fanqingshengii]MCF0039280.1 glycosyltransferase family 4 protein [Dyadobacter fanqingshengii]USJ33903.1 glycosyltransferase family 4 protein [Dyadobacter fanqingshengii]